MRPFGLRDKIGYMFGDVGNDFSFLFISSFLMVYYTDALKIDAVIVGTILLVARLWDAVMDITIGRLLDTSRVGKKGKFRPWILRMSFPLVLIFILMFVKIPGVSQSFYLVYAFITYLIWGTFYSAVNIPYGSMASVISDDPAQRTSLSIFRTLGSSLAGLVVGLVTPMVVLKDGHVIQSQFTLITIIYGLLALVSYTIVYAFSTERLTAPSEHREKISWGATLKGMGKNRPLLSLVAASLTLLIPMLMTNAMNAYLFKNYYHNTFAMSIAGLTYTLSVLAVMPFAGRLSRKYGKKEITSVGLLFSAGMFFILYLVPIANPFVFDLFLIIANCGVGLFNVMIWALVTDVIDYQEYIVGKREDGTIYAVYSFARKIGQALAGGIGGFALAAIGYSSKLAQQPAYVSQGIKNVYTLVPAIGYLVIFLILAFVYPLSKKKVDELTQSLREHHQNVSQ